MPSRQRKRREKEKEVPDPSLEQVDGRNLGRDERVTEAPGQDALDRGEAVSPLDVSEMMRRRQEMGEPTDDVTEDEIMQALGPFPESYPDEEQPGPRSNESLADTGELGHEEMTPEALRRMKVAGGPSGADRVRSMPEAIDRIKVGFKAVGELPERILTRLDAAADAVMRGEMEVEAMFDGIPDDVLKRYILRTEGLLDGDPATP